MARRISDAILIIMSLLNILTQGAPLREGREAADFTSQSLIQQSEASNSRLRAKRCTCYSFKDTECVYYCHMGIIWINTPQRPVPYGMSSYHSPQRLKRSSGTTGLAIHQVSSLL
ncbi:endothelin-3b [Misgurnus anguillicaudatus]|uniref:endothelin-3b n=1 Tax=Misgurnus anguillicaudatus TaxID=75329 RepID=UPI003CCF5742